MEIISPAQKQSFVAVLDGDNTIFDSPYREPDPAFTLQFFLQLIPVIINGSWTYK